MDLSQKYKKIVLPALVEKFKYKSPMAAPKIEKIIINCGFGSLLSNKNADEREKIEKNIVNILSLICGQKPKICVAKKSIATFKLRKGLHIGAMVTLRGKRMYDFLEKLIYLVLPRTRDFRGLNLSAVTSNGDLTIGFKEYTVFPEVVLEKEKGLFGLEVVIVTTAKTKEEGLTLLKLIGIPFKKED